MKKKLLCLILALIPVLSGCGEAQSLPEDWETDWSVVSPVLAVEPFADFSLYEQNDALYLSGIYYATWVTGDARPHTNEAGEAAEIFDAQIYVILQEYRSPDSAKEGISQWIAREKTTFEAGTEKILNCAGQEYTLVPLQRGNAENPYRHGAAAFGIRGSWAVCVEFLTGENYDADTEQMLEAFLEGFHFNG